MLRDFFTRKRAGALAVVFSFAVFFAPATHADILNVGHDAVNPLGIAGVLEGNPHAIVNQLLATIFTWVFAAIGSIILFKIIQAIIGLRVSESEEYDGLDLSQHGESGYNMEDVSIFGAELEDNAGNAVSASPQY